MERTCDDRTFAASKESTIVPIPASLAKTLDEYRRVALQGRHNSRTKDSFAVLGYEDEHDPALVPWRKARDFFQKHVHLGKGKAQPPSKSELLEYLRIIENAISIRLGFFFDAKRELQAILDDANKRDGDRYDKPTKVEIDHALSNIGEPHLRSIFFSNLSNPEWVYELDKLHVFDNAPGIDKEKSLYRPWPESTYLKSIALIKPSEVTSILLRAAQQKNPIVRAACVDVAAVLPIKHAAKMAEVVASWAREEFWIDSHFWTNESLIALMTRLLKTKERQLYSSGIRLFHQCFIPRSKNDDSFYGNVACMPEYSYGRLISQIITLLNPLTRCRELASFTAPLLQKDSKITSDYLVPDVAKTCREDSDSVKEEVICQLVVALSELLAQNEGSFIGLMRTAPTKLARRCGLHVLSAFFQKARTAKNEISDNLKKLAHDFLLSDAIRDGEYDPEFYPLMKNAIYTNVVTSLEAEHLIIDSYNEMLQKYSEHSMRNDIVFPTSPDKRTRRWQHRALFLIGAELLEQRGIELFETLSREFGNIRYQAAHVCDTVTITGPNSPLQEEEMEAMGSHYLLEYLKNWSPSDTDRFQLISREGLGRVLQGKVSENPFIFANAFERTSALCLTYQCAILAGLTDALKSERVIPVEFAVNHAKQAAANNKIPNDEDRQCLKRMAGELLEEVLRAEFIDIPDHCNETILDTAICLSSDAEPDAEYEDRYGGENMDPLTLSMNTVRPASLRALARWVKRSPQNKRTKEALRTLLEHCPNNSTSLADAGAFGEMVPVLAEGAPSWLKEHYEEVFGSSEVNSRHQVVITIVLTLFQPSMRLLEFLTPALENALDHNPARFIHGFGAMRNRNCMLLIGDWLYYGYAVGFVSKEESLFQKWQRAANAQQAGSVLNHLCSLLERASETPDPIVQRIGSLWDHHREVLAKEKGFGAIRGITHLANSDHYAPEWWGPRMLAEYTVSPGDSAALLDGDKLVLLSTANPDLALDIFEQMLKSTTTSGWRPCQDAAISLLQAVKVSHGGHLTAAALRCRDALGKIGYVDLDKLV